MSPRSRLIPLAALAPALVLASCKSPSESCDNPAVCDPQPVATTVTVSPSAVELQIGATEQLSATVRDQNGAAMTGAAVTWSSGSDATATVSGSGLVTGVAGGSTTITATSGSASGMVGVTILDPCAPLGSLAPGDDFVTGILETGSCPIVEEGFLVDLWELVVGSTATVQIDVTSGAFDAVLGLYNEGLSGLVDVADNSHATGSAGYDASPHLNLELAAGTYLISLTSTEAGKGGEYQVAVGFGLPCEETGAIAVGGSTSGAELAAGDCYYGDGYYADSYVVQVTTAGTVVFTQRSAEIDSWLTLYDPAGNGLAFDDDTGGGVDGLDAQISINLQPGWYVIEASSAFTDELGAYTLSVD